jgi:hypothetical protein
MLQNVINSFILKNININDFVMLILNYLNYLNYLNNLFLIKIVILNFW